MRKSYQQMMKQIQPPARLNERVLNAARRSESFHIEEKKPALYKPLLCAVCAAAILIGGSAIGYRSSSIGEPVETIPFGGLIMTACAAEFPAYNANGGLGLVLEEEDDGGSLFQIQGTGICRVSMAIEGGVLGREGTEEALTQLTEDYRPDAKYTLRLNEEAASLTVTANEVHTVTFHLTEENLRPTKSEDGQVTMVPQLVGDPAQSTPGIYAVELDSCRWLTWPLANDHTVDLSMPYGERVHPVTGAVTFHTGIDIPAGEGTEIGAAACGVVVESGFDRENGFYLVLDHGHGLTTRYHHCKQLCVGEGDRVEAGDTIALVGRTGMATGCFLHFEVRQDTVAQNPIVYFNAELRALLDTQ